MCARRVPCGCAPRRDSEKRSTLMRVAPTAETKRGRTSVPDLLDSDYLEPVAAAGVVHPTVRRRLSKKEVSEAAVCFGGIELLLRLTHMGLCGWGFNPMCHLIPMLIPR